MAFMNQDKKAVIAAQLKAVMPAGWKYSLRVSDHSTLRLLIASAPVDLLNARPDDAEERAVDEEEERAWATGRAHPRKNRP